MFYKACQKTTMPSKSKKTEQKDIIFEYLQAHGVRVIGTSKNSWIVKGQKQGSPTFYIKADPKKIKSVPKYLKHLDLEYTIQKELVDKNGKLTGMCELRGFSGEYKMDVP